MFENQYRSNVLANPSMRRLARAGLQPGNAFGVMHPLQTHCTASIAGALCNVTSDEALAQPLPQRHIVDLVQGAPGQVRWRACMESCVAAATPWAASNVKPENAPPCSAKHNPFASLASIVGNQRRWRCIDNKATLFADLPSGDFPGHARSTPNMWSAGHWVAGTHEESPPIVPLPVDQQAAWVEALFGRLRFPGPQSLLALRSLVVGTLDESDFESHCLQDQASPYDGPNQIHTLLLGDVVEPGFEDEGYPHSSLLRTVDKHFGLGHIGRNDAASNGCQFLRRRHFEWSDAEPTPFGQDAHSAGPRATAQHAGAVFVFTVGDDGALRVSQRALASAHGSTSLPVGVDGVDGSDGIHASGGVAAASTLWRLVVVAIDRQGVLRSLGYDLQQGWLAARNVCACPVDACTLSDVDNGTRLMLAARQASGGLLYGVGKDGSWGRPVAVSATGATGAPGAPGAPGQARAITLGCVGAPRFLLARQANATMHTVSHHSADDSTVQVAPNPCGGPWGDTKINVRSPSDFPVAHFSSWPAADLPRQPLAAPCRTAGPMAAATLDVVLHRVHTAPGNPQRTSDTFSLSSVMTPAKPVSYWNVASSTPSNGFGTPAEAGWSHPAPLVGASCVADAVSADHHCHMAVR